MRGMLCALAAGLALAGGAAADAGLAQPYGYYPGPGEYAYRYAPPRAYDYDGRYTRYSYDNGGYYAPPARAGHARYDRYGPDPNGLLAPDGHVIKCKLATRWSGYYARYVTRRECW
jgi:hypothetical protein